MYDYLIIGSGFGGSVSALRLTEKGYRVAMLEQGRRISAQEMKQAGRNRGKFLFWEPRLGLRGYFSQVIFKHMAVVRGIEWGGSLVYAAVLFRPGKPFQKR